MREPTSSFPQKPGFYLYTPDAATTPEIQVYVSANGLVYDKHLRIMDADLPGTWRPFPLPVKQIVVRVLIALSMIGLWGWFAWQIGQWVMR